MIFDGMRIVIEIEPGAVAGGRTSAALAVWQGAHTDRMGRVKILRQHGPGQDADRVQALEIELWNRSIVPLPASASNMTTPGSFTHISVTDPELSRFSIG